MSLCHPADRPIQLHAVLNDGNDVAPTYVLVTPNCLLLGTCACVDLSIRDVCILIISAIACALYIVCLHISYLPRRILNGRSGDWNTQGCVKSCVNVHLESWCVSQVVFKSQFCAKGQRRWIPCIDRVHIHVSPQNIYPIWPILLICWSVCFWDAALTASGVMCVITIRKQIWYVASPCVK